MSGVQAITSRPIGSNQAVNNSYSRSTNTVFENALDESIKKADKTGTLEDIFERAAKKYGVPENLLKAVAKTESNFTADAVSSSGAQGIMQLMPRTAKAMGVSDAFDPEQNIMGGAKLLSQLMKQYKGDTKLVLAAYNAGSGNVAKYGGIPPFKETQNYVVKVMKYFKEEISLGEAEAENMGNQVKVENKIPVKTGGSSVARPTGISIWGKEEDEDEEEENDFTYEDYLRLMQEWDQQMKIYTMEKNLDIMESLFYHNEE